MAIKLVLPSEKYLNTYLEACDEMQKLCPNEEIHYKYEEGFFGRLEEKRKGINLPDNRVASTELWLIDDNKFIGKINIRHLLNEKLLGFGGTIGYGIRLSERRKGYGTKMLSLCLDYCHKELGINKVMITCNVDNIGSEKIMLNNGGVFAGIQDAIDDDGNKIKIKKYWINIVPNIIEGERFYLREYKESDFDDLCKIYADPENMKDFGEVYSIEKVKRLMDWTFDNYKRFGFGFWAIIDKNSGDFIGDCGLSMQRIDGEWLPEIGYHIKKEYHHQHYASDAAQLVKKYIFNTYDFKKLYSYTNKGNIGSVRVMLNNGMTFLKKYNEDGEDFVVYSISK